MVKGRLYGVSSKNVCLLSLDMLVGTPTQPLFLAHNFKLVGLAVTASKLIGLLMVGHQMFVCWRASGLAS